jgi:hypothetical protein
MADSAVEGSPFESVGREAALARRRGGGSGDNDNDYDNVGNGGAEGESKV